MYHDIIIHVHMNKFNFEMVKFVNSFFMPNFVILYCYLTLMKSLRDSISNLALSFLKLL